MPRMSKIAVGVAALSLLTAHCSSSTPSTSPNKTANEVLAPTPDASTCPAPASAETLDAGYGCMQGTQAQSGCSASQYELVCFGTDVGAAMPSASLGCTFAPVPGQVENLNVYCCPCP